MSLNKYNKYVIQHTRHLKSLIYTQKIKSSRNIEAFKSIDSRRNGSDTSQKMYVGSVLTRVT